LQDAVASATATALSSAVAAKTSASAKVTQTRPNNTTGYTAGDVVGNGIGAAAGATLIQFNFPTLTSLANGGEFMLTSVELDRLVAGLVSGETTYRLYLYSTPPITALLDNAAFSLAIADSVMFLDVITGITPAVPTGSAYIYGRIDGINHQYTLKSNIMYGYLVTDGGYTPVANTVLDVTVHGLAV
jgi:hypothetical protein